MRLLKKLNGEDGLIEAGSTIIFSLMKDNPYITFLDAEGNALTLTDSTTKMPVFGGVKQLEYYACMNIAHFVAMSHGLSIKQQPTDNPDLFLRYTLI